MRILTAIILTLALTLTLAAACDSNNNTTTPPANNTPNDGTSTLDNSTNPPASDENDGNTIHNVIINRISGEYEGEVDKNGNIVDGWGIWMCQNWRYEGYFKNGMPNGEGILCVGNDDTSFVVGIHAKGNWVDGYGEGIMTSTHTVTVNDKEESVRFDF